MAAEPKAGSTPSSNDAALLGRAKALQTRLELTFERLLARQGLSNDDLAHLMRRLERAPVTRRELDAARREACGPAAPTTATRLSPPLPRNPRALRV